MCAPSAPNPQATIQQQTASNKETAIAQAGLNYVNQTGPNGSLNYEQIGTWADGTPRFQANTTLSAAGQALQNTGQETTQNLANVAKEQSGRLSGLLNAPNDWSAQLSYLNNLTDQNLNPQWDRMEEQNEQALINRGLRPGSTAYNNAVDQFRQSRSSAYNNANLNNFTTAQQSQAALRAQPLNEILALAGQSQVQTPTFGATPQTGIAGTDVAGITNAGYNQQLQQYNAGQQQLGGLFSAGASLIPLLSDRRAKENIKRVGTAFNGLPIYTYTYAGGTEYHLGFMADEVAKLHPEAVERGPDGFDRVFYSKAVA